MLVMLQVFGTNIKCMCVCGGDGYTCMLHACVTVCVCLPVCQCMRLCVCTYMYGVLQNIFATLYTVTQNNNLITFVWAHLVIEI